MLDNLIKAVRTAGIGVVGPYVPEDPGASTEGAKEGWIAFDYGTFFTKGQSMGTGQAPVRRYNRQLARPDHHRSRDAVVHRLARAGPGSGGRGLRPLRQAR